VQQIRLRVESLSQAHGGQQEQGSVVVPEDEGTRASSTVLLWS